MGPGICSRRQKGVLQTGLCLLTLASLCGGLYLYSGLQDRVKSFESLSVKYKQQQDALSAQLQVVYEHRSRLERSLQKERGEHKKTKEDFLVYKLEAQEALNKEKQDSMNRYSALSSQHRIVKNQLDDIRTQLQELHSQHSDLRLSQRRVQEESSQREALQRKQHEDEVSGLQDTILKLKEESKLLRKAHQDVHSQLLSAQAQVQEFRQIKEALHRIPSFNSPQALAGQLKGPRDSQPQPPNQKSSTLSRPLPQIQNPGGTRNEDTPTVKASPLTGQGEEQGREQNSVSRFPRSVHSLPDQKVTVPASQAETKTPAAQADRLTGDQAASRKSTFAVSMEKAGIETGDERAAVESWESIIRKVNSNRWQDRGFLGSSRKAGSEHLQGAGLPEANHSEDVKEGPDQEEELETDAEQDGREEERGLVAQEPMMPDVEADPAQDPNNQGEDEFEEAEIEHPAFEEEGLAKGGPAHNKVREPGLFIKEELRQNRSLDDPPVAPDDGQQAAEEYEEDQENENDDVGGEVDENEDLDLMQDEGNGENVAGGSREKEQY
ncbi:Golgi integral membrane protein 4-like isoform X1 [Polyodon spathula]|uniref:Golgi integral membrane protein 4-like isoform X1 n=1 Tax=Polyodon spathula TaxID=7913 RepID=UPI001B7EA8E4|nr:Golgi integral membrane protein 4-like isoform X1 [Polyodon spathula]